jgi:hypothetical protein
MFLKRACLCWITFFSCFNLFSVTVVYGDSRSQPEIHKKILTQIVKTKPKSAFHTGDMVSQGLRQAEYNAFYENLKPLTDICKFYPTIGNHERNRGLYFVNFPELKNQSYYTAYVDSMVWIVLDSTIKISPGSPQYKWLIAKLDLNKDKPVIILTHHPVFSSGEHGDELGLSLFLPALFANYPILAVFSGHDHTYERSQYGNQWYIVTGGGGAPLYKQASRNDRSKKFFQVYNFCVLEYRNARLAVKVYDINGKVIDEFTAAFKKKTAPEVQSR